MNYKFKNKKKTQKKSQSKGRKSKILHKIQIKKIIYNTFDIKIIKEAISVPLIDF